MIPQIEKQFSTDEKAFPKKLRDQEIEMDLGVIAGDNKNSWIFGVDQPPIFTSKQDIKF